jgi:hypothetical protein
VIAVDLDGRSEVTLHVDSFPCCADWLPDGRRRERLARREAEAAAVDVRVAAGIDDQLVSRGRVRGGRECVTSEASWTASSASLREPSIR